MTPWYRLDNAGKLYPSLSGRRRTTLFRISADLTVPVNIRILQESLDSLMPRFPYFAVHLKRGVFWYSLDASSRRPELSRDSVYPCMRYPLLRRGVFPFRVRVWRNRIAVEFSHVLSDGTGALTFLKSLLAEYLHQSGVPRQDCGELPVPGTSPRFGESEDAFRRFADTSLPSKRLLEPAFRLPLSLERTGIYRITTGIMPADILRAKSRDYGATVSEFLTAIMLDAFVRMIMDMPEPLRKKVIAPVRINVPVNLRSFWDTRTMRNFFVSVEPEIDPRLGMWSFEEILERTRSYMALEIDRRALAARMSRNIRSEKNTLARLLPLPVKDLFLPGLYSARAASLYTSGLSNLGRVNMPDHLTPWIRRFDFIPPPAKDEKVKASVIGWGNEVHLSFGRLVRPAIAELYVFRSLRSSGIPVKVESNI